MNGGDDVRFNSSESLAIWSMGRTEVICIITADYRAFSGRCFFRPVICHLQLLMLLAASTALSSRCWCM